MPVRADARGRTVLAPLSAETATVVLTPPRLPAAAVATVELARHAAAGRVPVLLRVPAAAGRLLVARALHAVAGTGPMVAASGRRPGLEGLPAGATLYLDVSALAPEGALGLEAALDDAAVWILAGTDPDGRLPAAIGPRLEGVVLSLPPLGARMSELPALAAQIVEGLAQRLGRPVPRLSAAALEQLQAHTWPGDFGELETVLARALLVHPGDTLDPEHLRLGAEVPRPSAAVEPAEAGAGGAALEIMLAELAHELRNPMVTIKTYAQHLPALLEDAELRERFATLCDEAIGRMDGLLENVLAFARLGEPRRQPIAVDPLLDRVLGEVGPELAGRAVRVRRAPAPAARCAADPDHLAYALRNLFAGVVREVPAREELLLDAAANGVVTLRFAAGGEAAERLRRLTAPGGGGALTDPTLLPLAFRLARAVLERNGGRLAVAAGSSELTTLVVNLPTAPAEEH